MIDPLELLKIVRQKLHESGLSASAFSVKCGLERHAIGLLLSGKKNITEMEAGNYAKLVRGVGAAVGVQHHVTERMMQLAEEYPIEVSDFEIVGPDLRSMSSWISWTRCCHSH